MKTYADLVTLIQKHNAPLDVFATFLSNVLPGASANSDQLDKLYRQKRSLAWKKISLGPVARQGQNSASESRRYQNALDALTALERRVQARIDELEADDEEYALAALKGAAERDEPLSPRLSQWDWKHIERVLEERGRG